LTSIAARGTNAFVESRGRRFVVLLAQAAVLALVLVGAAAGRVQAGREITVFCHMDGECTGTIRDPVGGPTIKGFAISAPGSTITDLRVNGHIGEVVPNDRSGNNDPYGEEIYYGNSISASGSGTLTFDASPNPTSLIFTPMADKMTYLPSVTVGVAKTPSSSTSPSANPQNPCNNQNNYDPKFPDYTQIHEYCGKTVTAITIHASVPLTAAGWYGPILNEPHCPKTDPKTETCVNITQLPKLTAFIVYASHPGGWPSGDTASVTFTFNDATKQTEIFWPH
jgi:hypothetical protein